MVWIIYALVVLTVSILVGLHLGRFRIAYTEMSGMMLGMMMGMLNGFLLGYAAAALLNSMFWGNLFGILLGLGLGIYYGRAGGLMGVIDGGMGGVMGGSMGAMLAVMVAFPLWAQGWTAVLLGVLYVLGMAGLVALIEQSAPDHAAFHRLLPVFARVVAREVAEEAEAAQYNDTASSGDMRRRPAQAKPQHRLVDYYAVLGLARDASREEISEAYREREAVLAGSDQVRAQRIERGLAILTDARKRQAYDRKLEESEADDQTGMATPKAAGASLKASSGSGTSEQADCCPPSKKVRSSTVAAAAPISSAASQATSAWSQASIRVQTSVVSQTTQRPEASVGSAPAARRPSPVAPAAQSRVLATGSNADTASAGSRIGNAQNSRNRNTNKVSGKVSGKGGATGAAKQREGSGKQQPGRRPVGQQQVRYAQTQKSRHLAISWVGAVAAIVIMMALGWWALSTGESSFGGGTGTGSTLRSKLGDTISTSSTGSLQLSVSVSPDPPQPGPSDLTLQVKDPQGQPVTGAQVRWSIDMTNMRMGPQNGQMTDAGSGRYQAKASFSMAGPWRINVEVSKDGQVTSTAYFDLQIH